MTGYSDRDESLALSNQLCFSVYSTAHAFTRLYTDLLRSLDVTYTQYLVLLVLWEEDGQTVREIGQRLNLDSGTLTPLLRRLEHAGYVKRERSATDQRRVHVHLTQQGLDARPQVRAVRKAVFEATGLTHEELKDMQSKLERLRSALSESLAAEEEPPAGERRTGRGERREEARPTSAPLSG